MAPCTNIRLALSVAPDSRIVFGSLEFTNANGPMPAFSLLHGQALCFGDLDFIANHLGQLHLHEGDTAPPHTPTPNLRPARVGPSIVDSNALARRIDAYLRTNTKPEQSWHIFYVLANAFTQLSWVRPMPLEAEFWDPYIALPFGMRDATTLFEQE
jgi:hypothetical protein